MKKIIWLASLIIAQTVEQDIEYNQDFTFDTPKKHFLRSARLYKDPIPQSPFGDHSSVAFEDRDGLNDQQTPLESFGSFISIDGEDNYIQDDEVVVSENQLVQRRRSSSYSEDTAYEDRPIQRSLIKSESDSSLSTSSIYQNTPTKKLLLFSTSEEKNCARVIDLAKHAIQNEDVRLMAIIFLQLKHALDNQFDTKITCSAIFAHGCYHLLTGRFILAAAQMLGSSLYYHLPHKSCVTKCKKLHRRLKRALEETIGPYYVKQLERQYIQSRFSIPQIVEQCLSQNVQSYHQLADIV